MRPLFAIKDEYARRVCWSPKDISHLTSNKEKRQCILLESRPYLLGWIDTLSDRQFEALGCVICRLLHATHVMLTPPGNEGGVDFFASITLPQRSHVLFGSSGPLRIVGQSKKYGQKVQVDKIKEFILTLEEIKHQSPHFDNIVPAWFRLTKGPILGWMVAHSGFQSGAETKAKNHGITLSDSVDLAEVMSLCRLAKGGMPPQEKTDLLKDLLKNELSNYERASR